MVPQQTKRIWSLKIMEIRFETSKNWDNSATLKVNNCYKKTVDATLRNVVMVLATVHILVEWSLEIIRDEVFHNIINVLHFCR
jgi:hypothetical protein